MNNQKYLIAANWKQNGDSKSLIKLINDFIKSYKKIKPRCEILIKPKILLGLTLIVLKLLFLLAFYYIQ